MDYVDWFQRSQSIWLAAAPDIAASAEKAEPLDVATLVAAIVAASAALVAAYMTVWGQEKLERQKWQQERRDQAEEKRRLAVTELGRLLAIGVQITTWLTWKAVNDTARLTEADLATYETEIKALLPQVVGAHLLVIAHDYTLNATVKDLTDRLYALDGAIARAAIQIHGTDRADGIAALQALCPGCDALHIDLLDKLADIAATSTEGPGLGRHDGT